VQDKQITEITKEVFIEKFDSCMAFIDKLWKH
jgi:hypothetical protein